MICHNVDTCTLKTEQNSYKENKKLLAILISYISQIDLLDTGSSSASPIVAIARCGVSAGLDSAPFQTRLVLKMAAQTEAQQQWMELHGRIE